MQTEGALDPSTLVIGQRVAWITYGVRHSASVGVVSRFTPTQIIVTGSGGIQSRFRRDRGTPIGRPYGSELLDPLTPRVAALRTDDRLRTALREIGDLTVQRHRTDAIEMRGRLVSIVSIAADALSMTEQQLAGSEVPR